MFTQNADQGCGLAALTSASISASMFFPGLGLDGFGF